MSEQREMGHGGQMERERVPDKAIAEAVRKALLTKLYFQTHPVDVSVKDGVVTLRGVVDSAEMRQEAAELAVMAPGVREIVNLIDGPGDWA